MDHKITNLAVGKRSLKTRLRLLFKPTKKGIRVWTKELDGKTYIVKRLANVPSPFENTVIITAPPAKKPRAKAKGGSK